MLITASSRSHPVSATPSPGGAEAVRIRGEADGSASSRSDAMGPTTPPKPVRPVPQRPSQRTRFLTQRLLPLLADGGAIVTTTSKPALVTGITQGYSTYASMKGGLAVLTRCLAKELSTRGIRVNSVAPGPTRTRMAHDALEHHPEVIPPIVNQTAPAVSVRATTSARSSPPLCPTNSAGSPARTSRPPADSECDKRHWPATSARYASGPCSAVTVARSRARQSSR
ncbi:MAG: SDR family oxidoreductase [Acidimicrobiales bacterium]